MYMGFQWQNLIYPGMVFNPDWPASLFPNCNYNNLEVEKVFLCKNIVMEGLGPSFFFLRNKRHTFAMEWEGERHGRD